MKLLVAVAVMATVLVLGGLIKPTIPIARSVIADLHLSHGSDTGARL